MAVAARWPLAPHRLRNFAIASLLLPATSVLAGGSWSVPAVLFVAGASRVSDGDWAGLRMMLALGVPFASLIAAYWWAKFVHKTNSVGLKSLGRTERVQQAIAARKFHAAARAAKLGAPYSAGDSIVLGPLADRTTSNPLGVWSELTARHQSWLAIPHKEARRHLGIFATTGAGKTELMKRYALAMFSYEWRAWQQWRDVPGMRRKHPRPLLAVISCKGGEDDRDLGIELRANAIAMGINPERIAMMPLADRLDIWNMPARDLRAVLSELLSAGEASTSEGQHFDEIRRRIVSLVVDAPVGAPRNSSEFLERLTEEKLLDIWGNAPDVKRMIDAAQAEKTPQLDDALIKCTNLFELLQDHNGHVVFDGGKDINDLDVLYVTVPGLDKDAARAQVAAILRLIMQRAGRTAKDQRRSVTAVLDEASALTTKKGSIGLEEVLERGRSQGVAMVLSSQSPEGVAPDQWSLNRLLKACAGGVIIGYCENAGDLCKHFGSIRRMLPSRHLIKGQRHGDEGQVSVGEMWLVDPDRVRRFDTGQVVYAKAGRAQWGQVIPVDRSELSPLPGTAAAAAASTSAAKAAA
ncbi:type IV secretory system conjugative DNA transfer family protein [Nocardia suismassiliense]|uniref:hypothetical protein n=1 Tax=Nocardia suismassiliense TaxID=2077092 RepID=UPI00131EE0B4|nr:hypothetical protein [Nocardia suismassiliense]